MLENFDLGRAMKKIFTTLLLLTISVHVFAGRYIEDSIGSSSGGIFDITIATILGLGALFYLADSFSKWRERQTKGEKPVPKSDMADWIFTLVGYLIISIFACAPIMAIFKLIGGADFVKETWYFVLLACFAGLTFLRRT